MDTVYVLLAYFMGFVSGWVAIMAISTLETNNLKRENERLNADIKKLTDRDERGRFKGGK